MADNTAQIIPIAEGRIRRYGLQTPDASRVRSLIQVQVNESGEFMDGGEISIEKRDAVMLLAWSIALSSRLLDMYASYAEAK